ncbi:MAG TPA: dNTP triphosphohydrolase [Aliidongia sp.]|uniref:dGTP triphosphohydrolase n=1 Tax=Aliidongia sp. TaxID=1914230 RepID=UPI002DDD51D0|nr:dNTP triphosphohydrolase [Aliidongia sp.]HEV2678119.1 dNTP triphosphohydrolase [Aliidongia sp.]
MMRWQELLSTRRLGQSGPRRTDDHRSPFEIDVDRFVFCSAFRRLQSKMQVHGPSLHSDQPGDYVRNRLTHSLEVSRVGRSLGQIAGQYLIQRGLVQGISAADVGHIVSGAAISHDVGQTPFSHQGEQSISAWWTSSPIAAEVLAGLPPEWAWELTRFEGNAFGFRLLTRLEGWQPNGGLQLTCATLAAFSKYPWSGVLPPERRPHPMKYGIFATELDLFREVAEATGLIEREPGIWCRHPLAHLTEAADDICYRIVDIEDAVQIGALPFVEAEELLAPLADSQAAEYASLVGVERKLTYLRARAISTLITDTLEVWRDLHDQMLAGAPIPPLLDGSTHKPQLDRIEGITRSKIYRGERRAETMLIASRTIDMLLDGIAGMLLRREATTEDAELAIRDHAVLELLNRGRDPTHPLSRNRTVWVREMMDTVASLTDHAAIRMAKIIAGGLGA